MIKTFFSVFFLLICLNSFAQKHTYNSKQKNIQKWLLKNAFYDEVTQSKYIFVSIPKSKDSLGVAQQERVFYANPNRVFVLLNNEQERLLLSNNGFVIGKQVTNHVYEIQTNNSLITINEIRNLGAGINVSFDYTAYTTCIIFNDSQIYPQTSLGRQAWIQDDEWIANNINNPTTHDIDSVFSWKSMHVAYSNSNPTIVVNIFDGGVDVNNLDFTGRIVWNWNFNTNTSAITATNHGSSVTGLAAATANNNYGGVGLWDGPVRIFQLSADGITFPVSNLYKALDSLYNMAIANSSQKQISNFSFNSGNDPIIFNKISSLYILNNKKQCFFQAASGNSGATQIDWPARWAECTGWGATATSNSKTIWPSSNTGDSLDFVNDGQNVWGMQANGSFAAINGTSFSTPLGTGTVANIVAQDTSRSNDEVRQLLREGARDLGAPGFDPIYGWGWAQTGVTLKLAVVRHVPTSFDAGNNPNYTYSFTPNYYNKSILLNRKCYYPNGSLAPSITNPDGSVSFNIVMNVNNGFGPSNNLLKYEFTTPLGCVTTIFTKPFLISNIATASAPIPVILNVSNKCQNGNTTKGYLSNPPANTTITITQDGLPLTYLPADSSFVYFTSGVTAVGNHTVSVLYANGGGNAQKDTSYVVSATLTPSIFISASSTTICTGTSVTFTAAITNGGTMPSYQWKVNGVNMGTNSSTFTSSLLSNNSQVSCSLTSNALCASPVLVTSNTITMTVNSVVTPTINITTSNTTVCSGTSVTFTAAITNGGATPSFQWKVNGVNAGTNSPTFATSTLNNNEQVTCIVTSNATCASPVSVTSNTITMSVNSVVVPTINISTPNTTVCSGTSVTFTAAITNGGTTPSFQWKVNGVNAGTNSPTFATSSLNNNEQVTCIVTSNATCASPVSVTSNTITMSVNSVVVPTINISTPNTTVCSGTSVTFTAAITNGGATPSFQWKVNGVNTGTNSPTFSSSSLSNNAQVNCVLTSNAFCASPVSVTSNTITMTVNSVVLPTINITTPNTTVCAGTSVTFTANITNGGNLPSYQWQINGASSGTNTNTLTINTLSNNDQVKCIVTSNANCVQPITVTSNTITMSVNNTVVPGITVFGSTTVLSGQSVLISSSVVNSGNSPTYQWQDSTATNNWQNISGAILGSINYSPLISGVKLRCRLTSNAVCSSPNLVTSNSLIFTVNPVLNNSNLIKYYPNPVRTVLYIDSLVLADKWETLDIYNLEGRQVITTKKITNLSNTSVNVESLSAGQYIVVLRGLNGAISYLKILKL